MKKLFLAVSMTACLMISAAYAQEASTITILNNIHHVNQKEIKVAKLALSKTKSPQVKDVAKMLQADHTKNDQELQALAKSERVKLKDFTPTAEDKAHTEKLKSMSGAQFDKAYLAAMKKGHEKALNMLESSRAETSDPQVSAFIDRTIPTVQHHEKTVAQLSRSLETQAAGKAMAGKPQGH